MNVSEYNLKKSSESKELSDISFREKCFTCFRPAKSCLCSHISPFATNTKFVILIHPMEAKKQRVGTGRISKAFLENSKLIMGVDFSADESVNNILDDKNNYCVVLYPGKEAFNISTDDISTFSFPKDKTLVVFVIDGTWPCARKMMLKSKRVRELPRICFTPKKRSQFIIKHQPDKVCLSTIESIHMLLAEMDTVGFEQLAGSHNQMLIAFKALNDYQINCAQDTSIISYRKRSKYKAPEERKIPSKWKKRKLFVD